MNFSNSEAIILIEVVDKLIDRVKNLEDKVKYLEKNEENLVETLKTVSGSIKSLFEKSILQDKWIDTLFASVQKILDYELSKPSNRNA